MDVFTLDPQLMVVAEVAKALDRSPRRVQQMIEAGDLAARKATDLEEVALRRAGRVGSPSERGVWLIHQDAVQHLQQIRTVTVEQTARMRVGYPKHRPRPKRGSG
jgi:hypothetical protein